MVIVYLSCAWLAGIFLGSKFSLPPSFILPGLLPLPFIFLFRQHRRTLVIFSLCIITFIGGISWYQTSLPDVGENNLRYYNEQGTITIKGVVTTEPEVRENTTHIHLSANEVEHDGEWHEVSGQALLFVPRYPAYHYGDVLTVSGDLETPTEFDDFDYEGYLAHQGI